MAIKPELLAILVDPLSRKPLKLVQSGGRERLHCPTNGLFYRIDAPDIPVLLIDEAELEDGSPATALVQQLLAKAS
jgi:uncharacterized protein YbaR (Trm112 family)